MSDKTKKRGPGFNFAWQGIVYAITQERNMQIHLAAATITVVLGLILKLSHLEWVLIILVIGLVLIAEMFNTCIELIMDYLSPKYHIVIKHIKDISAGAVFVTALTAVLIGLIIFLPKLEAIIN